MTEEEFANLTLEEGTDLDYLIPNPYGFFPQNFTYPRNTLTQNIPIAIAQNPAMVNYGIMGTDQANMFTEDYDEEYVPMPEEKEKQQSGIAKLAEFLMPGNFLYNTLGSILPKQSPESTFMKNFYGSQFGLTPTGSVASGIMKGYNPVSGGFLNMITGGKYGDPTKYGLQGAYQKRIDRIKKTLQDKYLSKGISLDETELDEKLANLEQLKLDEYNAFKKFIESRAPQPKGLGDIGTAGIDKTIQTGGSSGGENKFTESQKKSIRSKDLTGGPGKDYGPFSKNG